MGYAEFFEKLSALPEDKQAEVFDFVEFLASRSRRSDPPLPRGEWTSREFGHLSLAQAMRGQEDDAVTYSLADLKERWQ
ncbi:MAG: DUF2281 domain-containing protein [Rhodospirillales bacterium]|nr:DUF2281 domain-containing protein [Rhodospirillales bacterium]